MCRVLAPLSSLYSNFQKRFDIKFSGHEEVACTEIDKPGSVTKIDKLCVLATKYDPDNVRNKAHSLYICVTWLELSNIILSHSSYIKVSAK